MKKRLGLKVLAISIMLTIVASGIVLGANLINSEKVQDKTIIFDTGKGTYPSIFGEHQGNFTPKEDIEIDRIYTYPCKGTGGHSEFIEFLYQNGTSLGNASWKGYRGDWHNISFDEPVELNGNQTYKYKIKTGSYPQIIHRQNLSTPEGIIACTGFTDANGKKYKNWIPAVKFFGEVVIPDTTPPGPVTGLNESKVGQNYIEWVWNNPADPDFLKTMIYLDDEFKTNLSKAIAKYNATGLETDKEYKLGIKTVDESGNINQSIIEDLARTLKIPEKTWDEMDFGERKGLVEEFLDRDPTDYDEIHQCIYIADALHKNATNAKELYGLPCDIPMCLDHMPDYALGHLCNAVLLGDNKSEIEHWGTINGKDKVVIFDKNFTFPFEADRIDRIWKNGTWIIPDERYRLTNYKIGFNVSWLPDQKPIIEIIPTYPTEYQDLYPA